MVLAAVWLKIFYWGKTEQAPPSRLHCAHVCTAVFRLVVCKISVYTCARFPGFFFLDALWTPRFESHQVYC